MRNTPVTWPRAELSGGAPTKGRRFALIMGGGAEVPLGRGELIIGRSRSSQLVVDDMLISRHHARLLVSRSALFVEDLGSTNGVIVNENPIAGPTPLHDGDRLIVGSHEMQVRAIDEVLPSTEPPPRPATERPTPVAQQSVKIAAVSIQSAQRTIPVRPAAQSVPPPPDSPHPGFDGGDTTQRTEKQDGLLTMARMADRMIAMGRNDAASRLLGDHLKGVLAKAKDGRPVPPDVLETVGVSGARLSEVTLDATWVNIALELHQHCRRPLPERAIASLEQLIKLPSLDRALLLRYKAVLRDIEPALDRKDQALVLRISKIPTR